MSVFDTIRDALPESLVGSANGNDDTSDSDADTDADTDANEEGEGDEDENSGGMLSGRGDQTEVEEVEEQVNDIEYEVDELADSLESTDNTIETLENRQSNLEEEMEDVNDRIRNLLGVYDEFISDQNPFRPEKMEGREPVSTPESDETETQETTDKTMDEDLDAGDGELTIDDLRDKAGLPEAEEEDDVEPDMEEVPDDATEDDEGGYSGQYEGVMDDDTFLTKPPLTYAGEIVAYEWISHLIAISGSAGALKAMDYYESLDWLSPEVHGYMLTLMSAPAIDVEVETQTPTELSSETHKKSFRYIMKMSSVNREYVKEHNLTADTDD